MEDHVSRTCPYTEVSCPYADIIGCENKVFSVYFNWKTVCEYEGSHIEVQDFKNVKIPRLKKLYDGKTTFIDSFTDSCLLYLTISRYTDVIWIPIC